MNSPSRFMHLGLVRDQSEESHPCTQVSHCSDSSRSVPGSTLTPAANVIDASSIQYHPDDSMVKLVHSLNEKIDQLQSEMLSTFLEQRDKPQGKKKKSRKRYNCKQYDSSDSSRSSSSRGYQKFPPRVKASASEYVRGPILVNRDRGMKDDMRQGLQEALGKHFPPHVYHAVAELGVSTINDAYYMNVDDFLSPSKLTRV